MRNKLSILLISVACSLYAQQKNGAKLRLYPVPDTLYAGMDHVLVVFDPSPKAFKGGIVEFSGAVLAADIPGRPNHYRVRPTAAGIVEITITNKGKEIYRKKIEALPLPAEATAREALRLRFKETENMLH